MSSIVEYNTNEIEEEIKKKLQEINTLKKSINNGIKIKIFAPDAKEEQAISIYLRMYELEINKFFPDQSFLMITILIKKILVNARK